MKTKNIPHGRAGSAPGSLGLRLLGGRAVFAISLFLLLALLLLLPGAALAAEQAEHGGEHSHGTKLGERLPLWSVIPFAGILLSIALFPLLAPHFWHRHFPKISFAWAAVFAVPFLLVYKSAAFYEILHIYIVDYIPFILVLWSLFTTAGGICIGGSFRGTPLGNVVVLLIGTLLASWVGTTGASMIMIRPLLRMNKERKHKAYIIIFFIFLVSNIGGSLTPLGDPPLLLGFVHGVPFFWTMGLFPMMGFVVVLLLALFFAIDTYFYRKDGIFRGNLEGVRTEGVRVDGLHNLLFLGGILTAVLISGVWHAGHVSIFGVHVPYQNIFRDSMLILMGLLSLWTTRRAIRRANEFSWFPIKEVAYLFAGIFMTIVPALAILRAGTHGHLAFLIEAAKEPADYFWITGALSSFLDNAPTYLTFLNTALGRFYEGMREIDAIHALIAERGLYLKAISLGAVFMGANTYIGNAPNFMVKSISEEAGVRMPSFFGYMFKYSIPILIPCFLLVVWLFL
ncbi:MAG: sodium:proton antiporter [Candidatus Eisenbacteria bacterium]|nr:sodium:proton antiporter [Candidatus Eisenbacteria bacterium]